MATFNRRNFCKGIAGAFGAAALTKPVWAAPKPPNFVFILIDDMGWKDTGCYGSRFYQTPHTDALARQGMRFTNAYAAAPICSPTRASIMTGKYPARLHLTYALPPPPPRPTARLLDPPMAAALPLSEVTIAEALKTGGYTSAVIGKWHLGDKGFFPQDQGFDVNVGGNRVGMPNDYFYPYWAQSPARIYPKTDGVLDLDGKPGQYLTDRLTDAAVQFIDENKSRPFLLYLSHYAVHIPLQAKDEMVAQYQAKINPDDPQNNPIYAAMIQSVDESIGRVMRKLDDLDLTRDTVVFFTSDNGGLNTTEGPRTPSTSNSPLRGGKHFLYEGGIREPLIVRWPGVVRPGTVCDVPVISTDFYPTMMEMAGIKKDPGHPQDGLSLVPLLTGKGKLQRTALYWHLPHNGKQGAHPGSVIRQGDYKLIDFFDPPGVELYNLAKDEGEKNDLAPSMPEKVAELKKKLENWRQSVGAQRMLPNPEFKSK